MVNYFIAGVGTAKGFDNAGNVILQGKALTESGFSTSVSIEDVRGGEGGGLVGQYFHDSQFDVKLTDALMDLNYLALQIGAKVTNGGDVFKKEQVIAEEGSFTVKGTPKNFGRYGIIGWYTKANGSKAPTTVTFEGKTATDSAVHAGDVLCVTYVEESDSARVVKVVSNYVPAEFHLIITLPIFRAGTGNSKGEFNASTGSKIGEIIVDVERFQSDGAIDLSTTMTSAGTISFNGRALKSEDMGCDAQGHYAVITENIFNRDPFENVYTIVAEDGNVEIAQGETHNIKVRALCNDNSTPFLVASDKLTFTVKEGGETHVQVSEEGVITAQRSAGDAVVEIAVTSKPELDTAVSVTVA